MPDHVPESSPVPPSGPDRDGGPAPSELTDGDDAGGSATNQEPAVPPTAEARHGLTRPQRTERWFEVVTAIMLAVVAVATAWSVYQATRWAGVQSADYAHAAALRVDATRNATLSGQLRLYDMILTNNWINAHFNGNAELESVYEERLRPEFRPTFQAWLALDPFNNPDAPAGPLFMPEYGSTMDDATDKLETEADRIFEEGEVARELGDDYVLNTVFLAMVLFMATIADRFQWNAARAALLLFGFAMLLVGLYHLTTYPIA